MVRCGLMVMMQFLGHNAVFLGRGFDFDFGSSTVVGSVLGSSTVQLLVGLVGGWWIMFLGHQRSN